jgi:hypothetical protein
MYDGWFHTLETDNLPGEGVVTQTIRLFSTERRRATNQSQRNATFEGRPLIP